MRLSGKKKKKKRKILLSVMVSDQSIPLYKATLTLEKNSSKSYPCLSTMEVHKAIHQLFLRSFLTSFNNISGSG